MLDNHVGISNLSWEQITLIEFSLTFVRATWCLQLVPNTVGHLTPSVAAALPMSSILLI